MVYMPGKAVFHSSPDGPPGVWPTFDVIRTWRTVTVSREHNPDNNAPQFPNWKRELLRRLRTNYGRRKFRRHFAVYNPHDDSSALMITLRPGTNYSVSALFNSVLIAAEMLEPTYKLSSLMHV